MLGGTYTSTTYKGWQVILAEEEIRKVSKKQVGRLFYIYLPVFLMLYALNTYI